MCYEGPTAVVDRQGVFCELPIAAFRKNGSPVAHLFEFSDDLGPEWNGLIPVLEGLIQPAAGRAYTFVENGRDRTPGDARQPLGSKWPGTFLYLAAHPLALFEIFSVQAKN